MTGTVSITNKVAPLLALEASKLGRGGGCDINIMAGLRSNLVTLLHITISLSIPKAPQTQSTLGGRLDRLCRRSWTGSYEVCSGIGGRKEVEVEEGDNPFEPLLLFDADEDQQAPRRFVLVAEGTYSCSVASVNMPRF